MKIKTVASWTVKGLLALAVLYYIRVTVLANWEQVSGYAWDFNPVLMGISLAVFFVAYAWLAWTWGKVLGYAGHDVSFSVAWDIYFIGNLGRYIPGKVWTIAGTAWIADRKGLPPVKTATASVFAQAYSMISSLVFFAVFLILRGDRLEGMRLEWAAPLMLLFAAVFMVPRNLERILNRMLAALGRESISLGLTIGKAARIVGLYFISWLLFGAAFWLFVAAVTGDTSVSLIFLTAVFAAAYVGGFLAVFVPGGLGVRESLMSVLLSGTVPPGVGLLVAFLVRLAATLIEIICVLLILIRKGFSHVKGETAFGKR
ncbi:MAG: lysylphosphatidylglycerol synthase transmembrane domain-containing protein [Candidatus Latescibacterota bacterium]